MVIPLWCSLGRSILEGAKYDSPACSLSLSLLLYFYCTDLERVTFTEYAGNTATIEAAFPHANSNVVRRLS